MKGVKSVMPGKPINISPLSAISYLPEAVMGVDTVSYTHLTVKCSPGTCSVLGRTAEFLPISRVTFPVSGSILSTFAVTSS